MGYLDVPPEALDFVRLLATQGGTSAPPAPVQTGAAAAGPTAAPDVAVPDYQPPPLDLQSAKDSWLDRAMQFIGAAGARLDPSAFTRSKDRRTAGTLSAIMGGIGAVGKGRQEEADRTAARKNQAAIAQYEAKEAAKRGVYSAGHETTARAAAQQPFDVAAENRGLVNAQTLDTSRLDNAIAQYESNQQTDLALKDDFIHAEAVQRLRDKLNVATKYGVMSAADAAQLDVNKLMHDARQRANTYDIVPQDVIQTLNFYRQMSSDLRKNIMSISGQSADAKMRQRIDEMEQSAKQFDSMAQVLREGALAAGMQRLPGVPEADRPAVQTYLNAMFGTEGAARADRTTAATSPVGDEQSWHDMSHSNQEQSLVAELVRGAQTNDEETLKQINANIARRLEQGWGNNKRVMEAYQPFLNNIARVMGTRKPKSAKPDTVHTLTPGVMEDSEPAPEEYNQ
jgi:hypothetical protein